MSYSLRHMFVTSDHHFGSYKLPLLKVFSKKQEKALISKWNSAVSKNDIVFYNGDFCDGNLEDLCNYFKQLNGKITLIKGNHDNLPDNVYKCIFEDVANEVVLDDLGLTIHHCPKKVKTQFEIFGHMHRNEDTCIKPNSFCSCVQFNDGYPISLEKAMMKLI